jgi:CelD/BcsL family acetyltransferase involved in cellulose biosynthesis
MMQPSASTSGGTSGDLTVSAETFESLPDPLQAPGNQLEWASPFVLPGWLRAWWEVFAPPAEPLILSVREGGRLIGIAPLQREGSLLRLIGGADVCDHLDVVVAPRRKAEFCKALLDYVSREGATRIELGPIRPDSAVMTGLVPHARERGWPVASETEDVLFEADLPRSWEGYLELLSGKQRHEARRKLRRLEQSATFAFRLVGGRGDIDAGIEDFLRLFRMNRADKAEFMTARMEAFFRVLVRQVPATRLGFLDVDGAAAAAVMCFDHGATRYLYNSAFDAGLGSLSVGILCKILSIQDAIFRGLAKYDFLKGNETYKRQLGGRAVPVYHCRIETA